jgi:transcriptional regulator with XRE-family HTH domain
VSERSELISKLGSIDVRAAYIQAKLGMLVPAQIRTLRLKSDMPRQSDLANAASMQQSRISMFETPGAANVTLETLCRLAAAFKVGLQVRFVPFSEMLRWENGFIPSGFDVVRLDRDWAFLNPLATPVIVANVTSAQKTRSHKPANNAPVRFDYKSPNDFPARTFKIENSKTIVKPTIKDVKELPKS